ncbi:MAG: ribonuclease Z [Desulfatitalea sp.]|nr:ribonuclease Z [Desulfatitalea sp.]NNJ98983.1 ribonuclease Z [Desulfatitalea sp.]
MKITILGSGTCVPRLERSSCAVLIETGRARVLLDLGPGTLRRLLRCGVSIYDLTHIFLSHFHPDHTAELVPLIFATKYPNCEARADTLQVWGGQGLKTFYNNLKTAYGDWIVLPEHQMVIREIDTVTGETLTFEDVTVTARPMDHRPESLAFRIIGPAGQSVVYSGDTEACDALVAVAQDADLFICESAMPDALKVPGHMTPHLAGRAAALAGVRRLVLTHLYPECDQVDIVKQAQAAYKGPVTAARDLMTFDLGDQ